MLLTPFYELEEVLLPPGELRVTEVDGIFAFGHFAKAVHVELRKERVTCLRKDL